MAVKIIPPPEGKKLPSVVPTVTCRCGHTEHWERFNEDGLGFELPPMTFRCPSCKWQWRRARVPTYFGNGEFRSYKIQIQSIEEPSL